MNQNQNENSPKALAGVKKVILVASGKGGVGKSSVAVNLAAGLAKTSKVGLLDADIYGPSIPRMVGALGQRPIADDSGKMKPLERYSMKVMSIGFMIDEQTSIVWRGPMLFKAIDQFLYDVDWGDLDYLIIDLPPGTGDVQLTFIQKIKVTGVVVVTTPQNIALADVKKAIDMFERTDTPILGVIENMSYLLNPINKEKIELYPPGDLDRYLEEKGIIKIGSVPFNQQISKSCEIGIPLMVQKQTDAVNEVQEFLDICDHVIELVSEAPNLILEKSSSKAACSADCGCANRGTTL